MSSFVFDPDSPKVSVIMSVFNGKRHLKDAVESILAQTFKDFEFIVIDDGSTDSSPQIIEEYAKSDPRIRIMTNDQNRGLAWSLNRGISSARGDFIARMDADDISLPERLETQFMMFESNPELDLVACASNFIDEEGRITSKGFGISNDQYRLWRMQFHNVYIHSSVMFRKEKKYIYDENIEKAQDYELWCRIANKNNTKYLDIPLVNYRFSKNQISQLQQEEQSSFAQRICFRNLRVCYPRLSDDECQNVQGSYIRGRISLKEFKYLPSLLNILGGFFRRYEISIRDRAALVLLVIKDIVYWLRRSYLLH